MRIGWTGMWLVQIFDLHAQNLQQVEDAIRAIGGVGMVSALRDDQPYVVAQCPTQDDAMRVQHAVAAVDPGAIAVYTSDGTATQEAIGL